MQSLRRFLAATALVFSIAAPAARAENPRITLELEAVSCEAAVAALSEAAQVSLQLSAPRPPGRPPASGP